MMTFRIMFTYRCTDRGIFECGRAHKDIKAESAQEAVEALMKLQVTRGILEEHYAIWDVDIFQLIERPKNGWVERDNPQKMEVMI